MTLPELILSGIVPDYGRMSDPAYLRDLRDNIEQAITTLKEEYFEGPQRLIFRLVTRLYLRNQSFLDPDILKASIAADVPSSSDALAIQSVYAAVCMGDIKPDKFKHLADSLRKEKYRDLLTSGMTQAMEANLKGDVLEAKEILRTSIAEIESGDMEFQPAMELGQAADLVSDDYYQTKAAPKANRVFSGYDFIDKISGGWQPGELVIAGAFAAQGKSQLCLNIAYNNKVNFHKNVLIFSLEMPVVQYARRLMARHSLDPKFELPGGIVYNAIKNGSMTPPEEKAFEHIKTDLKNSNYGRIEIIQMQRGCTIDDIFAKATAYSAKFPIDLIAIDYITLVAPKRRRQQMREELVEVVKDVKQMALSFNKGKGVPLLALSQIGRLEYNKALKSGSYSITSFAETSEIERSSDMCLWLLRRPEDVQGHKLQVGVCKYRDNISEDISELSEDFAHSKIDNPDLI